MMELVFFLEERSAKEMLEGFLPKILPASIPYCCIPFNGKQDLEKHLVERMRRYRNPQAQFIILRDKDAGDCNATKQRLLSKCREAGREALVRIACHELESWYLADLNAVEKGLGLDNLSSRQNKSKYRDPDSLGSPSNELKLLTNKQYTKGSGSHAIGPHLDPDNTRSRSFAVFVSGVRRAAGVGA
jgi:hypothetical protein